MLAAVTKHAASKAIATMGMLRCVNRFNSDLLVWISNPQRSVCSSISDPHPTQTRTIARLVEQRAPTEAREMTLS